METLTNDPDRDVTTIKVDFRLSSLKPCHVKVLTDMYGILYLVRTKWMIPINILNPKKEKKSSRQDGGQQVSQIF